MSNIFTATLHVLKLPVKLLAGLLSKRPKKVKNELEQKQRAYVRNFDPTRLNNKSWKKSSGKYPKNKGKRKQI